MQTATRALVASALAACLASPALTAPLDDIPKETVSERKTSPPNFGWNSGYDIEFEDSTLKISVDVKLNFDAGISAENQSALKDTWESGIEDMWNNKFNIIKDGTWRFPVKFDVNWVDPHHTVRVQPGPARSNMTTWDTDDTGRVAAHEFGHMLGLFDEYNSGAQANPPITDGGSIMGSTAAGAVPKSRHFKGFADWLTAKSPTQTFTVEPYVQGGIEVIGALSNFDVVNNSGQDANDFEIELGSVEPDDIKGTFPGFGDADPEITDTGDGVKIRWAGNDIPAGSMEHFGVRLKDGTQTESATASWTKDGALIAFNAGLGIDQYYTAAAGLPDGMVSTIRNTSPDPLLVSFRHSEVLETPLLLPDLNQSLVLPWIEGGIFTEPILLNPGEFIVDIFDLSIPGATEPGTGVDRSVVSQIQVSDPLSGELLTFFTNQGTGALLPPTFDLVLGDFNQDLIWSGEDTQPMLLALDSPQLYLDQYGLAMEDLVLIGDFNGDGVFDAADLPFAHEYPLGNTRGDPLVWGDLNVNDQLDLEDLLILAQAIQQNLEGGPFDYDLDGSATPADNQFWVEVILGSVLGDANLDFNVDLIDLSILASHFLQPGFYGNGDFNTDGFIDLIDLSILASNFGFTPGVSTPEPATAALLGLGLASLARRRSAA
jgi:hypothetical protein